MRGRMLVALGSVLMVIVACSQAGVDALTGVPKVPMPSFQYSFIGCLSWSCASGQCPNDTAVWGACCLEVSEDPEEDGLPRPSCGSGPTYCESYPSRCSGDVGPNPGLAHAMCFNSNPYQICNDPVYEYNPSYPNRCGGQGTMEEFPECFPTSGIN